ncbi:MAG: tetratricopeptide repeat protein, partial [Chloroflexota bacterium]
MAGKQKVYEESMAMAANYSWDQDWPNAVKSYRAALEEFPQETGALVGLGTAYFELEQYESAVRALQRALQIDSSNQDAMNKIGEALEKMGRMDDAAKTYLYSGNLYAKTNQLEYAITSWENAIRLNAELDQARNNLAQAYARTGRKNDAAIELVTLAASHQQRDLQAKAQQFLQGATQLAPNNEYVIASRQALEAGTSIQAVLSEINTGQTADQQVFETEETPEDDWLSFSDSDEDDRATANPREKASQVAMES